MNQLRRTILKSIVTFIAGMFTGFRWLKPPAVEEKQEAEPESNLQRWQLEERVWVLNKLGIAYHVSPDGAEVVIEDVWWWDDESGLDKTVQDFPFRLEHCPPATSDEFDVIVFCVAKNVKKNSSKYLAEGPSKRRFQLLYHPGDDMLTRKLFHQVDGAV